MNRFQKIFSNITGVSKEINSLKSENENLNKKISASSLSDGYNTILSYSYTGEKNLGELGHAIDYKLDYNQLRIRSWQAYIESEIAQIVLRRFNTWVIGNGLKLQSEPSDVVLKSEKIDFEPEAFNDLVEARFRLWASSETSSFSDMHSLHKIASTAHLNALVGGDVLCILRIINKEVKVQLIDGEHICNPYQNYNGQQLQNGNIVRNGIEQDSTGKHIAYYVRKKGTDTTANDYKRYETERILARATTGQRMAFMIYGSEYRIDTNRGMPLIACMLETMKKLERYKEATVGSAEERQKIVYQIVHEAFSTGENPLATQIAKASGFSTKDDIPVDSAGKKLADTVAASTNKMAFNMPNGSELKSLESKNELYFKDFYSVNIDVLCATVEIPPNVAMSKYDSNYSASRAAIKDWEHTLNVYRKKFADQFYRHVYSYWLDVEILKNKISAPGYLSALNNQNNIVLNAYRNARFIGAQVPHIDPMKEVLAERAKLGDTAASIPLTTVERATEAINGGDSNSNMEQYSEELEYSKSLKIITEEKKN